MRTTDETFSTTGATGAGMSRRALLRTVAAGSAAAAGATALAVDAGAAPAGGRPTTRMAAQDVDVTLLTTHDATATWGISPMPSEEEQAANPSVQAYAETLQDWLDANPGVTIELISLDETNPQALVTAIAGGTAPSWYGGYALGEGQSENLNAAFQQGLMADITSLTEKYAVAESIRPEAMQIWESFRVGGAIYSLPGNIMFSGNGMFYRRDLIQELGLEEPQQGWTWADVRSLAAALTTEERKGIGLESWALGLALDSQGYSLLTKLPDPESDWNWRWDYTSMADKWAGIIQDYRDMIYVDESALVDITIDMPQVADAFGQGVVAMGPIHSAFMNPVGDTGIPNMPNVFGKPLEELVGFVALPQGPEGYFGATQPFITHWLYNPDLDEVALDKGVNIYCHMWYGDGYIQQRQRAYEISGDPARAYDAYAPVNGITQIEGVPVSLADVWPSNFLASTEQMNAIPIVPTEPKFIPPEPEVGPTGTAASDAQSSWTFERGERDLREDLRQLEENRNAEAGGFESGVPDEEFVAGARAYYEAHAAFWQEHAPEFYEAVYQPWYDQNIVPALG